MDKEKIKIEFEYWKKYLTENHRNLVITDAGVMLMVLCGMMADKCSNSDPTKTK